MLITNKALMMSPLDLLICQILNEVCQVFILTFKRLSKHLYKVMA